MTRTLDVTLLFDVEDVFHPPEVGNDDIIKDLAEGLSAEGVVASFLFIGRRAQLLAERGRRDVIEAVRRHEVGLHTLSGEHPTMPEYCAGLGWFEGLEQIRLRELAGLDIIRTVFDAEPNALSRHGDYTAPQVHALCAEVGKPYIYGFPTARPSGGITWYCGSLNAPSSAIAFYVPEDDYAHDAAFAATVERLDAFIDRSLEQGQTFVYVFLGHPLMYRCIDWPVYYMYPNGTNVPQDAWPTGPQPRLRSSADVALALRNFRKLARKLAGDARLNIIGASQIPVLYGGQEPEIDALELLAAAGESLDRDAVVIRDRFTPAEICLGLADSLLAAADSGVIPERVPRRPLLGPLERGPLMPERWSVEWAAFIALVRRFRDRSLEQGYLVHQLHEWGCAVGLGSFYAAMAETFISLARGARPEVISFRPFNRNPEEAHGLGYAFLDISEGLARDEAAGKLVRPDLDTAALVMNARLQTWTMRPARRS